MERKDNQYIEEAFDLGSFSRKLKSKWPYFLVSVVLCLLLAFMFIKIASPKYSIGATVLIKSGSASKSGAIDGFNDLGLSIEEKNLENEVALLLSYRIMRETIEELDFKVSYYNKSGLLSKETYRENSFKIVIDTTCAQLVNLPFYIKRLSETEYILKAEGEDIDLYDYQEKKTYYKKIPQVIFHDTLKYGKLISLPNLSITIYGQQEEDSYFMINDLNRLAEDYRSKVRISPVNKNSSILELSIESSVAEKEIDFMNKLLHVYISDGLVEKNQKYINTVKFIDRQLLGVSDSLQSAANKLQTFRKNNQTLDLNYEAKNIYDNLRELETRLALEQVKDRYYNYLSDYVGKNKDLNEIVAPSVAGIQDGTLNSLINELAALNTEKAALSYTTKEKNSNYQVLILKIGNTRKTLIENLNNLKMSSKFSIDQLRMNIKEFETSLTRIPETEKELINVQRKYMLNDNIYTFLLQKRAESAIAKEATIPDARIVDSAKLQSLEPVFPNKKLLFSVAFIVGLMIPIGFMVVKDLFNETITKSSDVKKNTSIPVIGIIPHFNKKDKINYNKSLMDSFRYIIMNLKELHEEKHKIITVSSYANQEGKTFCALQLGAVLAKDNNKTLLVNLDINRPGLLESLIDGDQLKGLKNFLSSESSIEELITNTTISNLDVVEPIYSDKTISAQMDWVQNLINSVNSRYDFIILLSPSISLSLDYWYISKFSHCSFCIIKHNYSLVKWLSKPNEFYNKSKSRNLYLLINDVKGNDLLDWNSYGYIHEERKKKKYVFF